jgi:actin-like ATPase involved in cell morphogenesis
MIAAIDFGASTTKAALYRGTGEAVPVSIDDMPESSSMVFLQPGGQLICGTAAVNSSRGRPERAQAVLKRRINRTEMVEPVHQDVEFSVIASRPLVRCVATVISHAWTAILDQAGSRPGSLLLTHPVGWSKPQRAALLEAARLAGTRPSGLLSEAEAVGWHVRAAYRPAGPLLVVDLGASTLDIALLELSQPDRMEVRYADGDNYIGGDDFDREIIDLVQADLRDDPGDAALLDQFEQLCATRPHVAAREAERIKLALAVSESATFAHRDIAVTLQRDDFLRQSAPLVGRIVNRVRRAIDNGGKAPATMVVSGGAARLRCIQDALAELALDNGIALLAWEAVGLTGTVTTAVALGAARMPRPWPDPEAEPIRPVTLEASRIWPGSETVVAVPDGVVVRRPSSDGPESEELVREWQANPTGTRLLTMPAGITQLSYDASADQLVTASRTKTICTWQLTGLDLAHQRAYGAVCWRGRPPPAQRGPQDEGTVTALAARGGMIAWTESEGPGAIICQGRWRAYWPDFPVRWLAFTGTPHLLVVGDRRLVLVEPTTAEVIAALPPEGTEARSANAVALAASALVLTASGRELVCYNAGNGRFDPVWRRDCHVVPPMAVARIDRRPALVMFDAPTRVYRALDAETGEQFALKDLGGTAEPVQLLAAGTSGVVYARHGNGSLSRLTFAGTRS